MNGEIAENSERASENSNEKAVAAACLRAACLLPAASC